MPTLFFCLFVEFIILTSRSPPPKNKKPPLSGTSCNTQQFGEVFPKSSQRDILIDKGQVLLPSYKQKQSFTTETFPEKVAYFYKDI